MRKTRIWIAAGVVLLLAAVGGWYVLSPAWTLRQMAAAARAHDAERLSGYIDYPALRASTKAQIKAGLNARLAAAGAGDPEAGKGPDPVWLAAGLMIADTAVDTMITPSGMTAIFAVDSARKSANAGGQAGAGTAPSPEPAAEKPMGLDAANREIVREGLNGFRLHEKGKAGQDGDLIFERHGLSWKLARIQVPEHLFNT